ncbi:DsbA family domain protein [Candidatus Bealeia paramacronuclearis]|uniref:DsbA family domain protein n=1 Tax=Candidatus Bealeia paramacronuclearis TaxID=1921001 RepID=A0ABZ2C491_9PROT|nr:DsbA family domain protein [Candidatus Bealeia paramacronuclearis]
MKSYLLTTLSILAVTSALSATDTTTPPTTTATVPLTSGTTTALTSEQAKEVQQLIQSTIQSNPKMVIEALQAGMEQAKKEELTKMKQAVASNSEKIFKDPDAPKGGSKTGPVILAIFADPNCGACKMFQNELNKTTQKPTPTFKWFTKIFRSSVSPQL